MYRVTLTRDYKYCKGLLNVYETRWKVLAVLTYYAWDFVRVMSAYPKTTCTIEKIPMGKIIEFPRRRRK